MTSLRDIATEIETASAEPYLRATGWEIAHQGELGNRWRLRLPGTVRNVAVPLPVLDAVDHARMFAAMLEVLVEVEGRDAASIVRDVSNAALDLLEFRLMGNSLHDGQMPLKSASELTGGAYDAVLAAARAEIARRAHFGQGTLPTAVRAFVDSAVLADTARGSVILRVRPPAPHEPNPPVLDGMAEPDPFERRAVTRLLQGVLAAKAAAHQDFAAEDDSALDEAVEAGLSANLCDALLKLAGTKSGLHARVAIRVRWALTRSIRPTDQPATEVEVNRAELGQLDRVAERLKEIQPLPHLTVRGPVVMTRRAPDEAIGVVHVIAEVSGKARTVRIALDRSDYDLAAGAHIQEQEIQVVGTLERAGTVSELIDPVELTVVSPT